MKPRHQLLVVAASLVLVAAVTCTPGQAEESATATSANLDAHIATVLSEAPAVGEQLVLSDDEWRERLTAEQYRILRQSGTERAFTGHLWDNHGIGTYHCAGCGAPLFSSATKFESGTGWPSYYEPIEEGRILEIDDFAHGMHRTEVRCARCDGHLGHVFADGPPPTGLRYCINSAALTFRAE